MNKGTEALIADLLRAAVKIGVEKWVSKNGEVTTDDYEVDGVTYTDHICNCEIVNGESIRAEFIAKANPANVLGLIAAMEQAQTERDSFKFAFQEWSDKTEWVQKECSSGRFGFMALGMHRADVMTRHIEKLEATLEQAQRHEALTDAERQAYVGLCNDRDKRIAELQEQRDCWVERAKELGAKADKLEARQLSIPAGWKIVPTTATPSMARAGAAAAREYMTETGGNSPFVIYECMVLAAPSAELEAHQLSVKLPPKVERDDADGYWLLKGKRVSAANGAYYNEALNDVAELIRAAGGTVEGSD